MSRFSEVLYGPSTKTVTVGAGLVWDDVYAALEPYGVNAVGARISGVGVAGFTLGGGYSWHTNQRGLTIDNVEAYELVKPDGVAINVTESSDPDLFVALKGGGNNFGIVTRFTFKTYPQTQVWGASLAYNSSYIDRVIQATANFAADNTDPKAAAIISYNYHEQPSAALWGFYDAPGQPAGIFDEFLAIPHEGEPLVQSFLPFLVSLSSSAPKFDGRARGVFDAVSTTHISVSLLEAVTNQSKYWGEHFSNSYGVQPFLPTLFDYNTTPSAYPPDRTRPFFPLSFFFGWESPEVDQVGHDGIRASAKALQEHITQVGSGGDQKDAIYPNYALFDTPLVDMYGANLPNLRAIHAEVDPENVMGLAGGFKF